MAMSLVAKLEKENQSSHAYLLIGNDQVEIEEAINYIISTASGLDSDVVRIEENTDQSKSDEIKIDAVRDFLHLLNLSSFGPVRVGIIERCERLNQSSANILLKVLEEPPKNVILILTATNENVIATIKSRCRVYKSSNGEKPDRHTFSYENVLTANLAETFKTIENIVKNDETAKFLDEILVVTEDKMITNLDPAMEGLAGSIIEARRRIRGNANPRLVLENLVLKARRQAVSSKQ